MSAETLTLDTSSSVAARVAEDIASRDAQRIAHRIAGIVANDERVRVAIQSSLDSLSGEQDAAASDILAAIAAQLTGGA